MHPTKTMLAQIRALLAEDDLETALAQLRALLENKPLPDKILLDEALLLSSRLTDVQRQIRLGTIASADANLTKNQLRASLLELLRQIEREAGDLPEPAAPAAAPTPARSKTLPAALEVFKLTPCTDPDPADWALYRNRRTYALDADGHLAGLNLCGCEVRDASFLQSPDFQYLQALHLGENKLTALHLPAGLRALQYLRAGDNPELTNLTLKGPLPALRSLTADACAIETFELPAGMHALETLDLRQNALTRVVFSAGCKKLSFLDLSQNKLKTLRLPGGFSALQHLYLNDNALEGVGFEKPIPELLEILQLRKNKLKALPDGLVFFSKLQTLYLHDNPLPNVPKGTSGVPEGERVNAAPSIRSYLKSITQDNAIPNDEVKLVLLGNSTAGKSSLLRYLREREYDESLASTHGISNILWPDSGLGFKINVWDFGGQEFYHATHRLFLSENAVSLVAFEQATNRQDEIELTIKLYHDGTLEERPMPVEIFPFSYWLDNLRYFCRGEQAAMLVQTKMDIADSVEVPDVERRKYGLPADTPRVSVKNAEAGDKNAAAKFEIFKEELFGALRKAIGKYPFSEKWLLIKNELRALPDHTRMMPYGDFVRFCEERRPGISRKESGDLESMLDTLTNYLHDTGVILWYRDHPDLRKTVFVKPKWVIDTIYKVLDYRVMEQDGGKFDRPHAARVAPDMDTDDLLALMEKFELIFPVGNEPDRYVAPQYLPDKDPAATPEGFYKDLADDCAQTLFTLRFPGFLPRSILTRFMCVYGSLAAGRYWKNGIIFKKDHVWFWVHRSGLTDITVRTNVVSPLPAHEIFNTFYGIADKNPELLLAAAETGFVRIGDLFDLPPGDDPALRSIDGKWLKFSAFSAILGARKMGEDLPGFKKLINPDAPLEPLPPAKPKIFISYAHADEHYKDELIKHLSALQRQGLIEQWNDRKIEVGLWEPQIERAMAEADIFLLLITANFLNSKYISEREIATAYQKYKAGKARIFPVICDFCHWELQPLSTDDKEMHPAHKREMQVWLGKFQAFPTDAKPIAAWNNKNEAYLNVVQRLTDEIMKMLP